MQSQVHHHNSEGADQQWQRELQKLKEEKDQTIQDFQQNNNHLTTQNQLQQNNSQLSTQTQEFGQQNEHYNSENQSLQQHVEQQTIQLQQLTVEKQQYQQEISKLRQQNEHYKSQNQSLQQQVEQQTRQLQELTQTQEFRQHNEHYKSENQSLQQHVEQQTRQLQNQTPTWVVNRREINLSDKELGRGAYGWVKEATFRGCKVAVKRLHDQLISDYNLRVFDREMTMAARCRHPNLLQFIGATNEGIPLIVTEIMQTSLRKKLERGEVSSEQIINVSIGIACGLNYLHKTTPFPILHRDVSSANVLLNPLPSNQWLAKLSDFGSFNFMRASQTVNAGNPVYAAPEALDPSKGAHSPAMDVYSFGVLLHEMCTRELPAGDLTPASVMLVNWNMPESSLVPLISSCVEESIQKRPGMDYLITELNRLQ